MTSVEDEDQDARLAQRLAEEAEDAQAVDLAQDACAQNLTISPKFEIQSRGTASQPPIYRITVISGWVASSVWVKT